jgi:endonuclease/exonuclease/phosphatase (EEP) superfamily protein YafD
MREVCEAQESESEDAGGSRGRYRRVLGSLAVVCWGTAAACTVLGSRAWAFDLVAQGASVLGMLGFIVAVVLFSARQRGRAWCVLVAAIVLCASWGSRALRGWDSATGPTIEILVANVFSRNTSKDDVVDFLGRAGGDVQVLIEPPGPVMRAMRDGGALSQGQSGFVRQRPERGEYGWMIVRSTDPAVRLREAWFEVPSGLVALVVERDDVRFGLVAVHLQSPRSASRWHEAMDQVGEIERAVRLFAEDGLVTVVAGDLNSTPTGAVSRAVERRCMVRRSTPALPGLGTYPAAWPSLVRCGIDDVLVPTGWGVASWERVNVPGSDHVGVMVKVAADTGSGGGTGNRANSRDHQP